VGEYVSLKKTGNSHKGLCPFHNEKTPSFIVDEGRGFYYCYGCHVGGDAIEFLREHVGYSFMEAVEILALRNNITIPQSDETQVNRGQRRQKRESRDRYFSINKSAMDWFKSQLSGEGLSYLTQDRKLTRETIDCFQLGFAPEQWDGLTNAICGDWTARRDALALGLISARRQEGRGHYDRYRNRVMFPVFALGGEVIGFSGRTLAKDKETPKYVNSSESDVFTKGRNLYGLLQAKKAIRERSRSIVVEGNVDVLTLVQAGFKETVSPMGTALTEDQCILLRRFTKHAVLVYDGDSAGRAAATKAVAMLLKSGVGGQVVKLPDGTDPDTFVVERGAEALDALISEAPPLFDHVVNEAMVGFDGSVPAVSLVIDTVGPVFQLIDNAVEQDLYRRNLAHRLNVSEDKMRRWLRSGVAQQEKQVATTTHGQLPPRREKELMGLLLRHPRFLPYWQTRLADWEGQNELLLLSHAGVRLVIQSALANFQEPDQLDVSGLLEWLSEQENENARTAAVRMLTEADPYHDNPERAFVELCEALEGIAKKTQKSRMRASLEGLSEDEQVAALSSWSQVP
jgi:DNA primase